MNIGMFRPYAGAVCRRGRCIAALLAGSLLGFGALAAEVKVLTAATFKPVLLAVVPGFEKRTGHKVEIEDGSDGALAERIRRGEPFDLAVLPPALLESLAKDGAVSDGSITSLARVLLGLAVKKGAPMPDIRSSAAVRQALLSARSVAYLDPAAGGSGGAPVGPMLDKLGIASQVAAKAALVPGGLVAQRVADGRADMAIHAVSEILAVPGAALVGPLPAELQSPTVYAGAVSTSAIDDKAALSLLILLASEETQAVLKDKGMLAP